MKIIKFFKIESKEETIECSIDATMITHYLGIDIAYPLSQMSLVDLYNLANIRVALLTSDGVPMKFNEGIGWNAAESVTCYDVIQMNQFLLGWPNGGIFKFWFTPGFLSAIKIGYETPSTFESFLTQFELPRFFAEPINLTRGTSVMSDRSVSIPSSLESQLIKNCFIQEPGKSPQPGQIDLESNLIHVFKPIDSQMVYLYCQVAPSVKVSFGGDYAAIPALPAIMVRIQDFENRRILANENYLWSGQGRLFPWKPMEHADLNLEISIYAEKSPEGYQDVCAIANQLRPRCNTRLYSPPHGLEVYAQVVSGVSFLTNDASLSGAKFKMKLLNMVQGES
jgi:hypothetical protein